MTTLLIGMSIGVAFIAATAATLAGAGFWLAVLAYILGSMLGVMLAVLWAWSREVQASAPIESTRLQKTPTFHAKDLAGTEAAEH